MNPYLHGQPAAADDWRDSAVCAQVDPELMFPDTSLPGAWEPALATCRRCPVRRACLADALAEEAAAGERARYGVRGGMKPRERWAITRATSNAA